MNIAIECRSVTKYYYVNKRKIKALKNINLQVKKGEILGLVGPNGSGKTTLLKIIAGLLMPDEGDIYVLGYSTRRHRKVVKSLVNTISGLRCLTGISTYTVKGVLEFFSNLYGVPRKISKERIMNTLKVLEMKSYEGESPLLLSSGLRRRLEIGKIFLIRTPIILLDEPTIHLDPYFASKFRLLIKELCKRYETTIIWASHYIDEVELICDRVAIMHQGRILCVDSPENLKRKYLKKKKIVKIKALGLTPSIIDKLKKSFSGLEVDLLLYSLETGEGIMKIYHEGELELEHIMKLLTKERVRILIAKTVRPTLSDVYNIIIKEGSG